MLPFVLTGVLAALAAAPHGHLRIIETGGFAGPATYSLRCGPPGGTLPRAARACGAIRDHPDLLQPRPAGNPFPCPFGLPNFRITGRYGGVPVDAVFGACWSGQAPLADRWRRLVPSELARLRVHPDRGIGLLRLGERERRIARLLGRGRRVAGGRFYPAGMSVAYDRQPEFDVGFTVAYRAHRAVAITSNFPETGWQVLTCVAPERALAHGAGPATVLAFTPGLRQARVSQAPPAC
jgi:hypothetical protein